MDDMDLFYRRILTVLRDGRSRNFQQILSEVGVSPNTLRLHLVQLVARCLVPKLFIDYVYKVTKFNFIKLHA